MKPIKLFTLIAFLMLTTFVSVAQPIKGIVSTEFSTRNIQFNDNSLHEYGVGVSFTIEDKISNKNNILLTVNYTLFPKLPNQYVSSFSNLDKTVNRSTGDNLYQLGITLGVKEKIGENNYIGLNLGIEHFNFTKEETEGITTDKNNQIIRYYAYSFERPSFTTLKVAPTIGYTFNKIDIGLQLNLLILVDDEPWYTDNLNTLNLKVGYILL
jgi:hypothetical protein